MRVALFEETDAIRLTVQAPCRLTDLATGKRLADWPELRWQEVRAGNRGLRIGERTFSSEAVLLELEGEVIFRINAQPYRGALILRRSPQGKLLVVNRLPLEDYLVGALTSEVKPSWPMEALKAHAVVSRTMVAHRIWVSREKPFDVTADTRTHLYYGVRVEQAKPRRAVEATRGQVLSYNGELISTTFHANCGGHTEDAGELWSVKGDLKPLSGVVDPYCKNLKHYTWNSRVPMAKLREALREEVRQVGTLTGLAVAERNRSGRARSVRLSGSRQTVTLSGRRMRERLGENLLRSLNFTVEFSPQAVIFRGHGWGHGVGLCQWGAYGMARRGKQMEEILAHYFPGTKRRPLRGLPGFSTGA